MPLPNISIDKTKCTECLLCVRDCVSGVLREVEGKARVAEPSWCNRCSHCVAICPTDAVMHDGLEGPAPRRAVPDRLDAECYREVVMTRRSARSFKPGPMPRHEIEDILGLAAYSPTASNTMDVEYSVIEDPAMVREIGLNIFRQGEKIKEFLDRPLGRFLKLLLGRTETVGRVLRYADRLEFFKERMADGPNPVTHDAAALVVIHAPAKDRFARENCAIAAANISNYAHAKGYGTCYLGLVVVPAERSKKLRAAIGVPEGRKAHMVLALGKPAYKWRNTPVRPSARVRWIGEKETA